MANGKIIKKKEKVFKFFQMALVMKGNGKLV